jgi:hypothetical protein
MFWKKEKKFLVCYWFKNKLGTGIGQTDVTCKDGIFRPGDVADCIKNGQGFEDVIIINVIPYKEFCKGVS